MSGEIRLSKEHGLNPSIEKCIICGSEMGIVIFGNSYKDESGKEAKAPMSVFTGNHCEKCEDVLRQGGRFFIEVRNGEEKRGAKNPYRTGRLIAVTKECAEEMFSKAQPVNYMEEDLFEKIFGEAIKKNGTA